MGKRRPMKRNPPKMRVQAKYPGADCRKSASGRTFGVRLNVRRGPKKPVAKAFSATKAWAHAAKYLKV